MANEQFLYNRPQFPAQLNMSHPLTRGLVGCWVLNENSPNSMRAWDSSPYHKHGLVTGAQGRWQGRLFNGTTDLITVPDHDAIRNLATLTILAWVYTAGTGEGSSGRILDKNASTLFFNTNSSRQLAFQRDYTGTLIRVSNQSLALNGWTFAGATMSSNSSANLYLNATEATYLTSTNTTGALANDTADLIIGNRAATDRTWDGLIGLLLFYNRILSGGERTAHYLDPYAMFKR